MIRILGVQLFRSSLGILCAIRLRLELSSFFPPPNVWNLSRSVNCKK
ncbi:hypothetical protein RDI58_000787 [Solanum bulbocastanum]|uniref:Uncharacterized protein n=1 Tax=Solanum bulbocastanum TaxID=147425 RepID=A0AAN8U6U2_SOLBU